MPQAAHAPGPGQTPAPARNLFADHALARPPARAALARRLAATRARSLALAAPLSAEDQCVQPMPDASPTKWHLAHTTWFFEAMVLQPLQPGYRAHDERWARLFNSYYESLGPRHPRPQRGLLTRPSLAEVHGWRVAVDAALAAFCAQADDDTWGRAAALLELGVQHEQQHQELLLTDILATLSHNPLAPAAYRAAPGSPPLPWREPAAPAGPGGWLAHPGGEVAIGHDGHGFAFDNELPRHTLRLQPFEVARRPVTNAEFQAFIDDGGYRQPLLWLSDGWAQVQAQGWQAPLYWRDAVQAFTLHGLQALPPDAPVRHLSFYEAAAYAEWAGARLPTEFEWEAAAPDPTDDGTDAQARGQATGDSAADPGQWYGHVWQWTRSSYDPYPRFRPAPGAVGEYNGKFMVGQIVLRGSSAATPAGHARRSYRNFFPPGARWQFSGLRLARDADV